MTVYVHKLEGQSRAFFGRTAAPDPWFILTADTDDELQAFAASLGLTRVMFRPAKQALPKQPPEAAHYVITPGEHDRAEALGAQVITPPRSGPEATRAVAGPGF